MEINKKENRSSSIKNLDIKSIQEDISSTTVDIPSENNSNNKMRKKRKKRDETASSYMNINFETRKKELEHTIESCEKSANSNRNKLKQIVEELEKQKNEIEKLRNTIQNQDEFIAMQTTTISKLVNIIQKDDYSIDHDGQRTPPEQRSGKNEDDP